MAERARVTRSSSNLGITSPLIGKPYKLSKRRKARVKTEAEKKEIAKYCIQSAKANYRLRSIKDILKEFHNDTEKGKGSSRQRRKSKLNESRRRSIAETLLIRNLEKETGKDSNTENELPDVASFVNATLEENGTGEEQSSKMAQENLLDKTLEVHVEKCDDSIKDYAKETDEITLPEKLRSSRSLPENQSEEKEVKSPKMEAKFFPAKITEEEKAARKENELKIRAETVEKITAIKKEQEEWRALLESYQRRLSEVKSQYDESPTGINNTSLSEGQCDVIEGRMEPKEFLGRLKEYQMGVIANARYMKDLIEKMQEFKENVKEYLSSQQSILSPEKEGNARTPRRLITNIIDRGKDIA